MPDTETIPYTTIATVLCSNRCHVEDCLTAPEHQITFHWAVMPFVVVAPMCARHWTEYCLIAKREGWSFRR